MRHVCTQFLKDEAGFIVAGELILISTILVVSLVVGMAEVSSAINHELNDIAGAFNSVNQSYQTQNNSFQQQGGASQQQGGGGGGGQSSLQSIGAQPETGG